MTSFSDVELILPDDSPQRWDTFPAQYVTQYLEDYLDNHIYTDRSLRDRVYVNSKVISVRKTHNGWTVQTEGDRPKTFQCTKLAIAAGQSSLPNMPEIPKDPCCKLPLIHHRDFGTCSETLFAEPSCRHVTVIGGGKSAADIVYAALRAEKKVNWLIRRSGEGPGIFMNPAVDGGKYRNLVEAGETRAAAELKPSGFRPMAKWAKYLHQTALGRLYLDKKFFAADRKFVAWANYRGRDGASASFAELEPCAS